MEVTRPEPLFRKIHSLQIPVPDLEVGLVFYRDGLGHSLNWPTATAAGLRLPNSDAEIVLQTEPPELEVDLLVGSADAAAVAIEASGGTVVVAPFDIQIGRCTVVADPWANHLVLLDMSKGALKTDEQGNLVGNVEPSA
jgi:lactoylglutathione lyase